MSVRGYGSSECRRGRTIQVMQVVTPCLFSVIASSCWRSRMVARTGIGHVGGLGRSTENRGKGDSPIHTKNHELLVVAACTADFPIHRG